MDSGSTCERPGCDQEIPPSRGQNARWCGRRCEGKAYRSAKLLGVSLAEYPPSGKLLPVGRTTRADPRAYDDYGDVPGDVELAAQVDDEQGIHSGNVAPEHESDVRARAMLQRDATDSRSRTPRATWREWRAFGKRNGIEHPAQTQDRIRRHQAEEAARTGRIEARASSGPQDRFDGRTIGHVAGKATESRALNARHVDRPPTYEPQAFSFEGEMMTGSFYRQGRGPGERRRTAAYAWDVQDGFRF